MNTSTNTHASLMLSQTISASFDNAQAGNEGWGIFETDGSEGGPWQLQREDETAVFPNDDTAWRYVTDKAKDGSAYHQSALDFLKRENMIEYTAILNFIEKTAAQCPN
ncbi:hypothetical protein LPN04_31250 [Rugamonas sp. A1-17]|nr:hypothetical protein [Rugamonas sp. A1-17]